jgi:DNA primase
MFPICDVNDAVVGFGGRMLPGGRPPKYKNSADGEVYNKSRILYGLNWARSDIVAHDEVVVCEGYTDVIGLRRSGVPRAVATCGTALTEEHVKLLVRFAHRIVLAFDADAAGRAAADRFHEWERSYDVQVYVADLPDGTDPGDLAQRDPERLVSAVADAVPFLAYRVERALAGGRLHEAEGRARAAEEAMALVAAHPDPLVRDQYAVAVAERLGFEPAQLRHLATEQGRSELRVRPPSVTDHERSIAGGPEQLLLRLLVHHPDADGGLVDPGLFADPVNAAALAAVRVAPDLTAAIESAGEAVGALLGRLAVEDVDELVLKDPMSVVARVVVLAAQRQERLLRAAQSARSLEEARAHQPTIDWVAHRVAEATQADDDGRDPAVEALVGWLRTRHAQEGGAGQ